MKITIDKNELERALARTATITDKDVGATHPMLGSVRLVAHKKGVLSVEGTDLTVHVRASAVAQVAKPGTCLVAAKDFYARIKGMPDGALQIEERASNGGLSISHLSEKRKYVVRTSGDPESFPDNEALDEETPIQIRVGAFDRLFKSCQHAISFDSSRPQLSGALFEVKQGHATMVATDGHRLCVVKDELGIDTDLSVLVPRKALQEIVRMGAGSAAIGLAMHGRRLIVRAGMFKATVMLTEAAFPPYHQVIPSETGRRAVRVKLAPLLDAVKACMLDKDRVVRLTFTAEAIELHNESPDKGEASDSVDTTGFEGKQVTLGASPQYLIDALSSAGTDEIEISVGSELDPVVVKSVPSEPEDADEDEDEDTKSGASFLAVIMPMRI